MALQLAPTISPARVDPFDVIKKAQGFQRDQELRSLMEDISTDPAPSAEKYQSLLQFLPAEQVQKMAAAIKSFHNTTEPARPLANLYGALVADPENSSAYFREMATAYENKGDKQIGNMLNVLANRLEKDPKGVIPEAKQVLGLLLSGTPEGRKVLNGLKENYGAKKEEAEATKLEVDTDTAQAKLPFAAKAAEADIDATKSQTNLNNARAKYELLQSKLKEDMAPDEQRQLRQEIANAEAQYRLTMAQAADDEVIAKYAEIREKSNIAAKDAQTKVDKLEGDIKALDVLRKATREPLEEVQLKEGINKLREEVRRAKADADIAEVNAKFAEPNQLLDMKESGWNIERLKSAANVNEAAASLKKTQEDFLKAKKPLELQRLQNEAAAKEIEINNKVAEKRAEAVNAYESMSSLASLLQTIADTPEDVRADASGVLEGYIAPHISESAKRYSDLLEQVQSTGALDALGTIDKSIAPMSNQDILLLKSTLTQVFTTVGGGDSGQFHVIEANKMLEKLERANQTLAKKYGMPYQPLRVESQAGVLFGGEQASEQLKYKPRQ